MQEARAPGDTRVLFARIAFTLITASLLLTWPRLIRCSDCFWDGQAYIQPFNGSTNWECGTCNEKGWMTMADRAAVAFGAEPDYSGEIVSLYLHGDDRRLVLPVLGDAVLSKGGRVEVDWPYRPRLRVSGNDLVHWAGLAIALALLLFAPLESGGRPLLHRWLSPAGIERLRRVRRGLLIGIPVSVVLAIALFLPLWICPDCPRTAELNRRNGASDVFYVCDRCLSGKINLWNRCFLRSER